MQKILQNLRENWITYGFETLVVIVGILGAFALNNWGEQRKQHTQDIEFLKNIKIELEKDLGSFSQQRENYNKLNASIEKSLVLFNSDGTLTSEDSINIEETLSRFQVLTPIYQNIKRNELLLSSGALRRFSGKMDQAYLEYVQKADHHSDVLKKLGETLQLIGIHDVWPYVDYKSDSIQTWITYNYEEIRNKRSVRNGFINL